MRPTTPHDFMTAGLRLLADHGPEALSLATLCDRVGVTKGSFYHHFDTMAGFHEAMLDLWCSPPTPPDLPLCDGTDASAQLTALRELAVGADHAIEVAIRGWATWYEPAARAVRLVERRRHELLTATFRRLGIDAARADTLARVGTYLLVGVQSDLGDVDRDLLDEVLTEYQHWIESHLPDR